MAKKLTVGLGLDEEWSEPKAKDVGCMVKALGTKKDRHKAALQAIEINLSNRPNMKGLSKILSPEAFCEISKPEAIAMLTSKYWGPQGVTLGVTFMETTAQELRDKIISHMNAWRDQAGANVNFAWSQSDGEVRISRGRGGYWSYLGTDILHIPKGQQTMNLEGFVLKTPESEYKRVVRHETGHTLGFPHEHMRTELVQLLDEQKTIAYFERTQGWSEDEVRQQVLTPLNQGQLTVGPVDATSIMCYQLPGSITKNGQPIPGGIDIDDNDAAFARKQYPLASGGGGNGGGKPPSTDEVVQVNTTKRQVVLPGGQVYKF